MAIEKLESTPHRISPINRIKGILYKIPLVSEFFSEKVFYNDDRSRKIEIIDWSGNRSPEQFNIALYARTGEESWSTLMKAMRQWREDKPPIYGIEIDTIIKYNPDYWVSSKTIYYESSTNGQRRSAGLSGGPSDLSTEEARKIMAEQGFLKEEDLPEFIDFEKTIEAFLIQALNLDFSNPVLIEKNTMIGDLPQKLQG